MGKSARRHQERRAAPAASAPARPLLPHPRLLAAALIAVAVLAVFAQTRAFPFVNFDDPDYVVRNAHVQRGLTGESIAWAFTSTEKANWHPLTWLSHMADVETFGLDAAGHHATAVALHALASILLFVAFVLMTGAAARSLLVALLFAIHPLHVESVAWIAERKDVLSGLFWCAGLVAYALWVRRPNGIRYALLVALFAAGLMAKPMMITFPFALLLLDWWPLGRLRRETARRAVLEKVPLLALVPLSAVVTVIAQSRGGAVRTLHEIPLAERVGNAIVSYATYLLKAFWPAPLSPFYPWHSPSALAVGGSLLLLAAVSAAAIVLRRRAPALLFGWLWFLGTLVPVIGIVQVGEQALADRYTYLPLIGIFAAIVWGLAEASARWEVPVALRATVATVWVVGLAIVAGSYAATWSSSTAFWSRAIAVADRPTSDMHLSLALAHAESGRMADALAEHRKAVALDPRSFTARFAYAATLKAAGDDRAAVAELQEAARLDPKAADVQNNLGNAYERLGEVDRAAAAYREALRLDPQLAEAHMNLATLLSRRGDAAGAVEHYGRALALEPESMEARVYFALALWNGGERARAVAELEAARARDAAAANATVTKALRLPAGAGNLDRLIADLRAQM